jgi:hypothetical protein
LVDIAVAVTFAPGITAPEGSVTMPEIDPVISARAILALRTTRAKRLHRKKLLNINFMSADLLKYVHIGLDLHSLRELYRKLRQI